MDEPTPVGGEYHVSRNQYPDRQKNAEYDSQWLMSSQYIARGHRVQRPRVCRDKNKPVSDASHPAQVSEITTRNQNDDTECGNDYAENIVSIDPLFQKQKRHPHKCERGDRYDPAGIRGRRILKSGNLHKKMSCQNRRGDEKPLPDSRTEVKSDSPPDYNNEHHRETGQQPQPE